MILVSAMLPRHTKEMIGQLSVITAELMQGMVEQRTAHSKLMGRFYFSEDRRTSQSFRRRSLLL